MRMLKGLLVILCSAVCSIGASAQDNGALSVLPSQGFQFTGNWECAGAFGNKKSHKSNFSGSMILGGKWLELTEQDTEPVTGYLAKYLIGYDPQQKQLVEFDANNFGAATYSSEAGWQNDSLTMTSSLSSDPKASYVMNRFIYSVKGKDSFSVDWEIRRAASSTWVPGDHLLCQRAAQG